VDYDHETLKQRLLRRHGALRQEFSRHEPRLRDLADNFMPRRARWSKADFGNGDKANGNIINNTPVIAARVAATGIQAAMTNAKSEWFRLTTPDPELAEWGPVREHLHQRAARLRWALAMGTFYRGIGELYLDAIWAGFGLGLMEEHPERLILLSPDMIGEYYLAANQHGEIDTIHRERPMTVRQLVREFGLRPDKSIDWSRFSPTVKNLWSHGNYDTVVETVNAIQPNDEWEPGRLGPAGMAYASLWIEKGQDREEVFLRRGGYEEFPGIVTRWAARAGEAYSRGLAEDALGDAKELQHEERRTAGMLDKIVNPPMVADEQTRGGRHSLVSGDVTYAPRGQGEGFKPAMEIRGDALGHGKDHIFRTEERIDRALMVDFFLKLLDDQRNQRATAKEIEELSQQTALQLGPTLEAMNPALRQVIDRGDAILERRGLMPPPPEELQGIELNVEFMSVMHQAQKGVGLGPIRVFLGEMTVLATMKPEVLDKVNGDEIADMIADATGIAPDALLADDEVEKVRAKRAEREAALEQGQAAIAAAEGAAKLASAPAPAPQNALGAVLGNLSPSQATGAALQPLPSVAGGGFPQPGGTA
jgi:hypothetical protein